MPCQRWPQFFALRQWVGTHLIAPLAVNGTAPAAVENALPTDPRKTP